MELADQVVVWLRADGAPRSLECIHRMLGERRRGVSASEVKEMMKKLTRRRFATVVSKEVYKIGPRYAAPCEDLPSTVYEMPPPSDRYAIMLDEFARMGGSSSMGEIAARMKAKGAVSQYGVVAELILMGISRGDLFKVRRGYYALNRSMSANDVSEKKEYEPQALAMTVSERESSAVAAEQALDEIDPGPDELRLAELLESKRERMAALETECEEYKRVRAHLGDLMSRNRESIEQTAREIEGLEQLHKMATLIRTAIGLG